MVLNLINALPANMNMACLMESAYLLAQKDFIRWPKTVGRVTKLVFLVLDL